MFRVFATLAVAMITSGCAYFDREAAAPVRTKIVKVTTTQTCTKTVQPDPKFCAPENEKNCPDITTCAEAYYRYTTCKHKWLDGGQAPRKGKSPDGKEWKEPDGIPCEDKCKDTALKMANEIRDKPFSLPTRSETVCTPSSAQG